MTACCHCGRIWDEDPNVYVCNRCRAEGHAGFNANCPKCEAEHERVAKLSTPDPDKIAMVSSRVDDNDEE